MLLKCSARKLSMVFEEKELLKKKNKIQATIGEDVAVEGFVDPDPDPGPDPDPLQNPPLFSFKSTYSPSGIVSI